MYGQHDPSMTLQHPSMVRTNPSMVRRNSSMVMITYLWSGGPMYGQHDPSMPLPSLCPIYNLGGLLYDPPGGPLTLL